MTTNPIVPSGSTFDAGLDELSYDFTKYQPGVQGVIPEPSTEQIEKLIEFLRQVMPTKETEDGKTTLDLDKLAEAFGGQDSASVEAVFSTAISEVCSGRPSAEQITGLPFRVKQRFYGWVLGTLLSPEA